MALTRSFKETVQARATKDAAFRQALFQEAIQLLFSGEIGPGRSVLRDYINATIGFEALAEITQTSPKSLMRMFGPNGNPTVANLFAVIHALQSQTGVHLEVKAVTEAA